LDYLQFKINIHGIPVDVKTHIPINLRTGKPLSDEILEKQINKYKGYACKSQILRYLAGTDTEHAKTKNCSTIDPIPNSIAKDAATAASPMD